jgi:hypothetical protein
MVTSIAKAMKNAAADIDPGKAIKSSNLLTKHLEFSQVEMIKSLPVPAAVASYLTVF